MVMLKFKAVQLAPITHFKGEYAFLSNMYEHSILWNGLWYKCAEAAFQSGKTENLEIRREFTNLSGVRAKQRGRDITITKFPHGLTWDEMRIPVMRSVLRAKFDGGESTKDLCKQLLETGNAKLIEGNTWHDNFWGVCSCPKCVNKLKHKKGKANELGQMLMELRSELRIYIDRRIEAGVFYDF